MKNGKPALFRPIVLSCMGKLPFSKYSLEIKIYGRPRAMVCDQFAHNFLANEGEGEGDGYKPGLMST